MVGTYVVDIVATDATGNVSVLTFTLTVNAVSPEAISMLSWWGLVLMSLGLAAVARRRLRLLDDWAP